MHYRTANLSSKVSMLEGCGDKMTRTVFKLGVALSFALTLIGAAEPAVLAAPPANDLRSGATPVTAGFNELLDTSEATTDADDAFLNSVGCNFPATDASVWYQFVGTGETFRIEVFQSSYSASVLIDYGDFKTFACGIGGIDFTTIPGHTYYMMALDDQRDGGGNGGTLNISINLAPPPPPPPGVTLSVDRFGTLNARTAVATISGTYSCEDADRLIINPNVWQDIGVFFAMGYNDIQFEGTCDGNPHTWSADMYPVLASRSVANLSEARRWRLYTQSRQAHKETVTHLSRIRR